MKICVILALFILISCSVKDTFILQSDYNASRLIMFGTNKIITPIGTREYENVKIGLIDVGITTHPNLNLVKLSNSLSNDIGHGTIVASIIGSKSTPINPYKGLLPGAKIYAYNLNSYFSTDDLIYAIQAMIDNDVDVISLSISSQKSSISLEKIIKKAVTEGIIIVASAGNSGIEEKLYPSAYDIPEVISVGSLDNNYNISDFSTYNNNIDIFFTGEEITAIGPNAGEINEYSGSSVAVPFVTSLVALTIAVYPDETPSYIVNHLLSHTESYMARWKKTSRAVKILNLNNLYKE
ncbi:S8 family peptidase [Paenibacillus jiagnxiensis]|uniref:S8 family peptidase n=1 Tax=Paenibacillus jiagnxiensis TaxID=3228926 RepID=UPI0033BB6367